jgi:predicted PurR-regulated permease PerM
MSPTPFGCTLQVAQLPGGALCARFAPEKENYMQDDFATGFVVKLLIVATFGIIIYIAWQAFSILLLLFIGVLLSLTLDGVGRWTARLLPVSRRVALFIVLATTASGLAMLLYFTAPIIADEAMTLQSTLPEAIDTIEGELSRHQWSRDLLDRLPSNTELQSSLLQTPNAGIFSGILGTFTSVFSSLTTILVIIFMAITISVEPSYYVDNFLRLLPQNQRENGHQIMEQLGHTLKAWLGLRLLSVVTTGILSSIGLMLLGIPGAIILGMIAGVFALIPFIGPTIGAAPGIIVAFTVGPLYPIYAALLYFAIQQAEELALSPLLERLTLALPPALTLSTQLILGALVGFLGVALAAPVSIMLIVLIREIYIKRILEARQFETATKAPNPGDSTA